MKNGAELVKELDGLWLVEAGVETFEYVAGEDSRLVSPRHLRQDHPIKQEQVESSLVA